MVNLILAIILIVIVCFWAIILIAAKCGESGRHFPGDPDKGGWPEIKKGRK